MLKKDEYNQDDYNDYYRQETQGAEISGSKREDDSGSMGKIIAFIVLIALAVGGYFGYKTMNTSSEEIDTSLQITEETSLPQTVQEEVIEEKIVEKVEKVESITPEVNSTIENKSVETAVVDQIQKNISSTEKKMTPSEVAAIVAAVMQQMNQQKETTNKTESSEEVKKDVELMDKLSDTEVDSVSSNLIKELENINIDENIKIDTSKKQIDVYNKVNVQDAVGEDTLSQLSNEINSVISEDLTEEKTTSYTTDITKEVATRQNEMRIIVVNKGDTLGKIAQRAYGNMRDYKKIYGANPELTRPDRIYIGQKLRIPN